MHNFMRLKKYIVFTTWLLTTILSIPIMAQEGVKSSQTLPTLAPKESAETLQKKLEITEAELDQITDIRAAIARQNERYTTPFSPKGENNKLIRLIEKNSDEARISDEALYWARLVKDYNLEIPYGTTFRDMMIVDPMFMPLLFKGGFYPEETKLYDFFWQKEPVTAYSNLYPLDTTLFADELKKDELREMAYQYVEKHHPENFKYAKRDLISDIPKSKQIKKDLPLGILKIINEATFDEVTDLETYVPRVRYWRPHFESTIQFSQNYISPNWHKGGDGNINLFTRNYFNYNYNKEKIQIVNELEWKASFYNAPKDTLHDYRVGDDVFRLHTNVGYKAFSKWFYTFDGEFRTQTFTNYATNSNVVLAGILAPLTINIGLGMKYELSKQSKKDKHRKLNLSVNLAPLSLNYMYSIKDDIDLGRHGFVDGKHYLTNLGSTIRASIGYNINRNVSWQSNFNYFTSYHRITAELENTFNIAISRFFSTRIYLNLRYDDGIKQKEDYQSYLQINELLSFGFNYRW